MCIFKILYCDILVTGKAKAKGSCSSRKKHVILLGTLQCMILERVKECPFRGTFACPTVTLIYSAFGSLITERKAFWTKCQGAQASGRL